MEPIDHQFMARALQLAERAMTIADPNPRVGCVLVKDGQILSEGWTQQPGEAHAEIHALSNAENKQDIIGATAYVSLEPCCFTGLTGPCTKALIEAGVKRVVYAMEDPNPKVAGQGLDELRAKGVEVSGPLLEDDTRSINPGFVKRMETGLPFVRVKMAMSLDGRTAMASGESKWITSAPARADVQRLRARSSAVVTGIGTILHDNPELTVRPEEFGASQDRQQKNVKQPLRVVLDRHARLSGNSRLMKAPGKVLHVTTGDSVPESALSRNSEHAYQHITLPEKNGKISLFSLLQQLAELNCNEVLIEAGATLAGQFLQQGLVDELVIFVAPKLMGSNARPLFDLPLDTMAAQLGLRISDVRAIGQDFRVTATVDPEA